MFAFRDRMDKEVGIWTYSSPNESPDSVKEEERGWMIGLYTKAEVAPFSSVEIGIRKSVLGQQLEWQDGGHCGQDSGWRSEIELLDKKNWCLQVKAVKKSR